MTYDAYSIAEAVKNAKHVYIIGNGGSYANASHIANDLLASGVCAHTLDAATLTASANDYGYETVFARWIAVVGREGDLLIALSGSGNSRNIVAAIKVAKERGMQTILITDYLKEMDMQESEEDQVRVGHDVARLLRDS